MVEDDHEGLWTDSLGTVSSVWNRDADNLGSGALYTGLNLERQKERWREREKQRQSQRERERARERARERNSDRGVPWLGVP